MENCCPNCGYCQHCGRSAQPYGWPHLVPQPYYPWTQPTWLTTGTLTIGPIKAASVTTVEKPKIGVTYFTAT